MKLFSAGDMDKCSLTPEEVERFKKDAAPLLLRDDISESEVLAWVKPTGEILIERITLQP